jgi:hypothetical protein
MAENLSVNLELKDMALCIKGEYGFCCLMGEKKVNRIARSKGRVSISIDRQLCVFGRLFFSPPLGWVSPPKKVTLFFQFGLYETNVNQQTTIDCQAQKCHGKTR